MLAGIIFLIIGVLSLALAIAQYRGKGPVFSGTYFAVPAEERQKLQTAKAYHYAGNILLYAALICLLLGLSFVLHNDILSYLGITMMVVAVLSGILFVVSKSGS